MKKNLFKVLTLIVIFTLLMINVSLAVPGKVNDSNVRVRSGPSTEGTETLTNLYLNEPVEVIEQTGDWYKVELKDGTIGYIFAEYVNVSGTVPGSEPAVTEEPQETTTTETPPEIVEPNINIEEPTEEPPEELVEEHFETFKLGKKVSGKYMPLMYSAEKVNFKKNETLKILDSKAFWSRVTNDKVEAWVLTSNLN